MTAAWQVASCLLAAASLATPFAGAAGQPAVPPLPIAIPRPDIERQRPELARLRDRLLAAIRERRVDGVRALMKPTVVDQDTEVPVGDVLASMGALTVGQPLPDEWRAFEQALRLGGVEHDGRYVVPFIEPHAPGWLARGTQLFVAGRDVAVREAPSMVAPIVTRVSYAMVAEAVLTPEQATDPATGCAAWTAIVVADRRRGWVCSPYVRHVSGLYYAFERVGDVWQLARIWSIAE